MGVPSFYRWLATKYPKIVVNAVEKTTEEEYDGSTTPNPNGIEFHNLYLDMNGIIHPCFHPEQDDQVDSPVNYGEVFKNIFDYIDRIVSIVRPRKLLYMAIDGVAPRAKMNQQRSRRFRTAKDRQTIEGEEDRLRQLYKTQGKAVKPKVESNVEDSNVITPGTEFMYELSNQLQTYIRRRIAKHPAWRQLRVILSDASSPGEGEHKIMSFIRLQRTCKGYDPNTSHVLYGLDADLIMLALATHEIHFSILRENVRVEDIQTRRTKFDLNRVLEDTAEKMSGLDISEANKSKSPLKKPYQFLHVWILREYLELDLKITDMEDKFVPDIERLIDDFIFICFFAGNDFLPHMPTLEIHEGALDLLMHVYKEELKNHGSYLVDVQRINEKKGCYIKLKRVEKFILAVGTYEDKIFKKRAAIHDSKMRRILSNIQAAEVDEEEDLFHDVDLPCSSRSPDHEMHIVDNTKMLKEQLKTYTREASDVFKNGLVTDMVKFGTPGYKKRYYKCKFSAETEDGVENMRQNLVEKYTQGLCWVLLYYFSDVPSWTWYYPYHYGPFASDMKGLSSTNLIFKKGTPFKPFDQLMAVLPPSSAHALPVPYQALMINEESSILDFYPCDFETDTDGKRFLWQGTCKLPFINEDRLLSATKNLEKKLTEEEAKRNMENLDQLFLHSSETFSLGITSSLKDPSHIKQSNSLKIELGQSGDIKGFVRPKQESVNDPDVLCVYYELPSFAMHVPRVLPKTTIPEKVVYEAHIEERELWHDIHRYRNNRNIRSYGRGEGYNGNHSAGIRNSCPDVASVGGRSGWNPRGRGRAQQSFNDFDTGSSHDESRSRSWWANSCPEVVNKGGGRGWSPRGRGEVQHAFHGSNSGSSHDQSRSRSWRANPCPEVVTKGGGSGWSPRGRGEVQHSSHGSGSGPWHGATRTPTDQTRDGLWRGSTPRGNSNPPATTNNNAYGKFWTVKSKESSSSSETSNRW